MTTLFKMELDCLENYRFRSYELSHNKENRKKNEYLLCIKKSPSGHVKFLDKIRRVDVTLWEIVKSLFGCGKLAGCNLKLTSIAKYLEQNDLSGISQHSQAYRTIHGIAARMLVYKKSGRKIPALWTKLSTGAREMSVHRCTEYHYNYEPPKYPLTSSKDRSLFLTPLTKFGHLCEQVKILEKWNSVSAVKVGGLLKDYVPWYEEIPYSKTVDDSSLKEVFFRVIEKVTHEFPSYPDYYRTTWGERTPWRN